MKNDMFALILAALLLSGCTLGGRTEKAEAPALTEQGTEPVLPAESAEPETAPRPVDTDSGEEAAAEKPFTVYHDTERHEFDLLRDGSSYTVQLTERVVDGGGWISRDLSVTAPDGTDFRWESGSEKAWFAVEDLNDDGRDELLFWYDEASDDYVTLVLDVDGGLRSIPFVSPQGDQLPGIGAVETVEDGVITMSAFQYVLGTYGGKRDFYLADDGKMHPRPDSMWEFARNERWLTVTADIPAALSDSTSTLAAGSRIRLIGWNGSSQVFFETEDGRSGTLSVSRAEIGWEIGGVGEHDAFESLPYAG